MIEVALDRESIRRIDDAQEVPVFGAGVRLPPQRLRRMHLRLAGVAAAIGLFAIIGLAAAASTLRPDFIFARMPPTIAVTSTVAEISPVSSFRLSVDSRPTFTVMLFATELLKPVCSTRTV